jgi:hypothetical protein
MINAQVINAQVIDAQVMDAQRTTSYTNSVLWATVPWAESDDSTPRRNQLTPSSAADTAPKALRGTIEKTAESPESSRGQLLETPGTLASRLLSCA